MAEERQSKGHAIMISIPYQGHIIPFVNLALKLASKGFAITFVHLEFVHHKLSKAHHGNAAQVDFFAQARESGLDISYMTIGDGFPVEYDRELHFEEYWRTILRDFPARVDEFVGQIIQNHDSSLAHFLVTDTAQPWPARIADTYNLVNVSLWTMPALVFTLCYHMDLLKENGHFPCKDDLEEEITYIPGVESINTRELMDILKESGTGTVTYDVTALGFENVKKADFVLHNTVHELEPEILSALNKYHPNYAIGPLNFSEVIAKDTVSKTLWSESDCTDWLDSKPHGSVLYVSFGSFIHADKQLIEEIAYGLLLSGVNFMWVIRAGISSGDDDVLPAGYEDEIKDKGLVVSWCNQINVLSNPAVAGFLTHNGWNSTVESMWYGVPMICYPVAFDQIPNRKKVVDDWKIGVSLCDGKFVEMNQVAEKIKSFMSEDSLKNLRKEAVKIKETLQRALEVDGSSERNFDQFVKDLEEKIQTKSQ